MIQPKRIGRFLDTDEHGFIQPDVAYNFIGKRWKPVVEFVVQSLMHTERVDSVYVRGSVPRGLALEHISDIDFIYIADANIAETEKVIEAQVEKKFSFVREIELVRLGQDALARIRSPQKRPYFHMLLKTQSLFLAGKDITREIAPFKPGIETVSHAFALYNEFSILHKRTEEERIKVTETLLRQWFSKRIVRSGLEITLRQKKARFTRDLYLCYEQFTEFYPSYKEQMYSVLVNCLNGYDDPLQYESLVALINSESSTLIA